ncbi:hypothetical protein [Pseudomonas sp. Marseille-QA0892]
MFLLSPMVCVEITCNGPGIYRGGQSLLAANRDYMVSPDQRPLPDNDQGEPMAASAECEVAVA